VVDEERIRPVSDFFWSRVSSSSCLQCLDTVGWVTGRASGTYKLVPLIYGRRM